MQLKPLSAKHPPSTLSGKSVLIADDRGGGGGTLELRCRGLGMRVETASDGHSTLLKLMNNKPDLLILDLNLPDVNGFKIVERLSDLKFPALPVIVLTAQSDKAAIQRCDELGVLYVHKDGWEALEKAIFRIFGGPNDEAQDGTNQANGVPRVLLVDDSPVVLKWLTSALQNYDLEVSQASNGMQGFWLTLKTHPDVVITDYNMEHGSGYYLLNRIKRTPSTQDIPVIVFTGQSLERGEERTIQRGPAAAFVSKPDPAILLAEIGRHIPLKERDSPA